MLTMIVTVEYLCKLANETLLPPGTVLCGEAGIRSSDRKGFVHHGQLWEYFTASLLVNGELQRHNTDRSTCRSPPDVKSIQTFYSLLCTEICAEWKQDLKRESCVLRKEKYKKFLKVTDQRVPVRERGITQWLSWWLLLIWRPIFHISLIHLWDFYLLTNHCPAKASWVD